MAMMGLDRDLAVMVMIQHGGGGNESDRCDGLSKSDHRIKLSMKWEVQMSDTLQHGLSDLFAVLWVSNAWLCCDPKPCCA